MSCSTRRRLYMYYARHDDVNIKDFRMSVLTCIDDMVLHSGCMYLHLYVHCYHLCIVGSRQDVAVHCPIVDATGMSNL